MTEEEEEEKKNAFRKMTDLIRILIYQKISNGSQ